MSSRGNFKVPKFKKKESENENFPKFNWDEISIKGPIGSGSFGIVNAADLTPAGGSSRKVIIKQILSSSSISEKDFAKEAKLLHTVKGHENIVEFIGVCSSPCYAVVQEYVEFSFGGFGDEKIVHSLSEFLQYVDQYYDCDGFEQLPHVIAKDIVRGMLFLHGKDIVHRDLKPANCLVSNAHYSHLNQNEFKEYWLKGEKPIVCKLTDFGESRSRLIQTQTLLASKVHRSMFDRGTLPYMSPELLLPEVRPLEATIADLKCADIWALGMVMYVLTSPSILYPFEKELNEQLVRNPLRESKEVLVKFLREKVAPSPAEKYEILQATEWDNLVQLHGLCNDFDFDRRTKTIEAVEAFIKSVKPPEGECSVINLPFSQSSAVEDADEVMAQILQDGNDFHKIEILNDGTNACSFLALKVCDAILALDPNSKTDKLSLQEALVNITSSTIQDFPRLINPYRNISKLYSLEEALGIMRNSKHLKHPINISEELPFLEGAFHFKSKERLHTKLKQLIEMQDDFVGIYTCEPFSLVVGKVENHVFILDTHKIPELVGGNGNAHLRIYGAGNARTSRAMCVWLWRRLEACNAKTGTGQSLALVRPLINTEICSSNMDENFQDSITEQNIHIPVELANARRKVKRKGERKRELKGEVNLMAQSSKLGTKRRFESNLIEASNNSFDEDLSEDDARSSKHMRMDSLESSSSAENTLSGHTIQSYKKDNAGDMKPNGSAYRNDAGTPLFFLGRTAFDGKELIAILTKKYPKQSLCAAAPINVAHNAAFLIDLTRFTVFDDIKCDDMGIWKHSGSPKRNFIVTRNDEGVVKEIRRCNARESATHELRRMYFTNASDDHVRKVIATVKDESGAMLPVAFTQYIFKGEEHDVSSRRPHGNSKGSTPFKRILPSLREKMKESVQNKEKPKKLLDQLFLSAGDVVHARSSCKLPRGAKDIYNARYSKKKANSESISSGQKFPVGVDKIWMQLEKAKRDKAELEGFIRYCSVHPDPFIVLASDRQLDELEQFCTDPDSFTVFGIAPTFDIFLNNISLTVTTYKNLRLEKRDTGKPPVFIGPLLLHQKKDWKSFSKFAHQLIVEKPSLEGMLACGIDGEQAMIDGLKRNFRYATFLRCTFHMKENIKRELSARGIDTQNKKDILKEIFGKQDGEIKFTGLIDCSSEEEFDDRVMGLKEIWNSREQGSSCSNTRENTFHDWFIKQKSVEIKKAMLKPVRIDAGLGDPPGEYTNNDTESANFMINHDIKFNPKQPCEFIEDIKRVIDSQFLNEDRAVFNKGDYRISAEFQHLAIDNEEWSKMTHAQRQAHILKFAKTGMSGRKTIAEDELLT